MALLKDLLDLSGHEWVDWKTKRGLVAICVLITVVSVVTFRTICGASAADHWPLFVCILLLGLGVSAAIWAICSGRFAYYPIGSKYRIVFCVDCRSRESLRFMEDLLRRLRTQLDGMLLRDLVFVERIAPGIVANDKNAHEYVREHHCQLLIWGPIFVGEDDGKLKIELGMRFTMPIPPVVGQAVNFRPFMEAMGLTMVGHKIFFSMNSLQDQRVCADQFLETILSLLAVTLCHVEDNRDDAILVLEQLVHRFELRIPNSDTSDKETTLYKLRRDRSVGYLLGAYKGKAFLHLQQSQFAPVLDLCNRFEKYLALDEDLLVYKALACYRAGDVSGAVSTARLLYSKHPSNVIGLLDLGFLMLYLNNFAQAAALYHRLSVRRRDIPPQVVSQVVNFLEEHCAQFPSRVEFRFAVGTVQLWHGDAQLGKEDLRSYLVSNSERTDQKPLIHLANEFLGRKERQFERLKKKSKTKKNKKSRR